MSKFKKIYIELSDICGLKCSFCPAPKGVRKTMPLDLFARVCQQSAPLCERIAFHVLGDPCKVQNLGDYLRIAKQYDLQVDLVTSGFYLQPSIFTLLLSPPIAQVSISLNAGFDRRNHTPKDYLENILNFCTYKILNDTPNFINLRLQDSTLDDLSWVKDTILEAFGVANTGFQTRFRLGKKVFLNITKTFEWPKIAPQNISNPKKYCHGLISQIAILSDGSVVPCCVDSSGKINLGNLKQDNLANILTTPRASRIREGFMRGEACEELCKHCAYPAKRL
ncbi:radical SAM/SPASM domain-containing protein [Helicobacter sp. 11S02596-1]|uniref:radical SAM/SPASM domain-containing protein n=1 Tax=Helicobacter sp. 11S02596-1 TaxID=1476194 RepID=UPI000BA6CC58|nr:radical SAM/SPASM domain-containing protein [Helicobacter sp. 11S02596-1]PAF41902.1 hypothetical protein BJI48_07530 [Helicobacter sp. 11S02596-1]